MPRAPVETLDPSLLTPKENDMSAKTPTTYRVTSIEGEHVYGVRLPHGPGVWFLGLRDEMPEVKVGTEWFCFDPEIVDSSDEVGK